MEKRVKYVILVVVGIGVLLAVSGCIELTKTRPYNITIEMTEQGYMELTIEGPPRAMELGIFQSEECKQEDMTFYSRIGKYDFENGKKMIKTIATSSRKKGDKPWVVLIDFATGDEIQKERVTIK